MKASKHLLSLVLLASLATACGGTSYQKDPAPDLSNEHQMTPDQAAQAQKDHEAQLEQNQKDRDADIQKLEDDNKKKDEAIAKLQQDNKDKDQQLAKKPSTTVVHDQVAVPSPSTTITSDYFTITLPDADMIFHEGQKGTYQISAKSLVPGVKICLVSSDLPKGATFTSCSATSQPATYTLDWTPAMGTVQNGLLADVGVHFSIKIMSATGTSHDVNFYQGLVQAKPATLHIEAVSQAPTDISVDSFPSQVTERS